MKLSLRNYGCDDYVRDSFYILFNLHRLHGLSGLCESLLGKPLNKDEQIGNWSKRPLRKEQISYAALDAWICMHIFLELETLANKRNLTEKFFEVVENPDKEKVKSMKQTETPILSDPVDPNCMKIVCDSMLEDLCTKLRKIGVDCLALEKGKPHLDCVKLVSGPDIRYVVSRGPPAEKIAAQLPSGHVLRLKSLEPEAQFDEVVKHFNIVIED